MTVLQKCLCILVRVSVVLMIASILFIVFGIIYLIMKKGGRYTRILVMVSAGIIALGIFISAVLLPQVNTIIKDDFYVRAELAATATLSKLPIASLSVWIHRMISSARTIWK